MGTKRIKLPADDILMRVNGFDNVKLAEDHYGKVFAVGTEKNKTTGDHLIACANAEDAARLHCEWYKALDGSTQRVLNVDEFKRTYRPSIDVPADYAGPGREWGVTEHCGN